VVKADDDLLSAIRVLCMQIRSAKVLAPDRPSRADGAYRGFRRGDRALMAKGIDFDVFTGE
jgi:hypothetical protein